MPPRLHRCECTRACVLVEELDRHTACGKPALSAGEQEGDLSRQGAGSDRVLVPARAWSRQVGAHHAVAPLGITGTQSTTR